MIINDAGTYTLVYTAEDCCGNETVVERTVIVRGSETFRTVLYTDGTLIINESSYNIDANVAEHGEATNVYDAMDEDHPYIFDAVPSSGVQGDTPWYDERNSITSVEIGSAIQPTNTKLWFSALNNCTSMDLTLLDTSNVTDMSFMFYYCDAITSLDLSGFDTSNVTDMKYMFYFCEALTSLDVGGFDTSNVTDMSYMFYHCSALVTIIASNTFVTTGLLAPTSTMFDNCTNLVGGNGTVYDSTKTSSTYARIDTADTPGYFTASA